MLAEPACCALMQLHALSGMFAVEQLLQEVGKQRVIAEPFALAIQRHQQAVEMLQPCQQAAAVVALAHGIGERGVDAFQRAGAQQQVAGIRVQVVDHLFGQICGNLRAAPGETCGDFLLTLCVVFQPQPRVLQRYRPAFGVAAQFVHHRCWYMRAKQCLCFNIVEHQVRAADAAELGVQIQPCQRQVGHAASGEQEMQTAAAVFDQAQHHIIDEAAAEPVVVVDNHADAARHRA